MNSMKAVVTRGVGGLEQLDFCDVPRPIPAENEVLLQVLAAGVNNTDVNTRLGWYSSSVDSGTDGAEESASEAIIDGGWNGATPFPLIQGTDCCGKVVELGPGTDSALLYKRVLVRSCMRPRGFSSLDNQWLGSDFNGAFAQYLVVPEEEVFPVETSMSDQKLGAIPCAYGTAENMLHRAGLTSGQTVLIVGASGGVGSASVQLAKVRGARVIALTSASKAEVVRSLGADQVLDRKDKWMEELGDESVDLIVNNVGGEDFGRMLKLLTRGGKIVSSGAIAGPQVKLDLRELYLKDLQLIGSTAWDEPVFPRLISLIEQGHIDPLIAGTFPLADIARAQQKLTERQHIGKYLLIP